MWNRQGNKGQWARRAHKKTNTRFTGGGVLEYLHLRGIFSPVVNHFYSLLVISDCNGSDGSWGRMLLCFSNLLTHRRGEKRRDGHVSDMREASIVFSVLFLLFFNFVWHADPVKGAGSVDCAYLACLLSFWRTTRAEAEKWKLPTYIYRGLQGAFWMWERTLRRFLSMADTRS